MKITSAVTLAVLSLLAGRAFALPAPPDAHETAGTSRSASLPTAAQAAEQALAQLDLLAKLSYGRCVPRGVIPAGSAIQYYGLEEVRSRAALIKETVRALIESGRKEDAVELIESVKPSRIYAYAEGADTGRPVCSKALVDGTLYFAEKAASQDTAPAKKALERRVKRR